MRGRGKETWTRHGYRPDDGAHHRLDPIRGKSEGKVVPGRKTGASGDRAGLVDTRGSPDATERPGLRAYVRPVPWIWKGKEGVQ